MTIITHSLPFLSQQSPSRAPWWGRFNQFHRGPLTPRLDLRGRNPGGYQCFVYLADKVIGVLDHRGHDWYSLTSLEGSVTATMRGPDVDGVLMRVCLGGVPLHVALSEFTLADAPT